MAPARGGDVEGTRAPERAAGNGRLDIRIRLSGRGGEGAEHTLAIGPSRCGKTRLLKALAPRENLVIVDTKGQDFDEFGPVTTEPTEVLRRSVCRFQPPIYLLRKWNSDMSDPWSQFLLYVREYRARTGVCLLLDEPKKVCGVNPHPIMEELVTAGMGLGVGILAGTQTAYGIYPPLLSDAKHVFLFRLHSATQRGTLAANLEVDVRDSLTQLRDHEWVYWGQGQRTVSAPHDVTELEAGQAPPKAPELPAEQAPQTEQTEQADLPAVSGEESAPAPEK